jgi:hypothetical protein
VAAEQDQVARLLAFAAGWPQRIWAVENANGLGRLLARQLLAADQQVVDVPASLAARVRTLSGAGPQDRRARREVGGDRLPARGPAADGGRRGGLPREIRTRLPCEPQAAIGSCDVMYSSYTSCGVR